MNVFGIIISILLVIILSFIIFKNVTGIIEKVKEKKENNNMQVGLQENNENKENDS